MSDVTTPKIGRGYKVEMKVGLDFLEIEGITSADIGSTKLDTIDVTTINSTSNMRRFINGLEDPGECTLKGFYLPTEPSQEALRAAKDGEYHDFKLTYPGAVATESFSAMITSYDRTFPYDKPPELTVKLKLSGEVTIA